MSALDPFGTLVEALYACLAELSHDSARLVPGWTRRSATSDQTSSDPLCPRASIIFEAIAFVLRRTNCARRTITSYHPRSRTQMFIDYLLAHSHVLISTKIIRVVDLRAPYCHGGNSHANRWTVANSRQPTLSNFKRLTRISRHVEEHIITIFHLIRLSLGKYLLLPPLTDRSSLLVSPSFNRDDTLTKFHHPLNWLPPRCPPSGRNNVLFCYSQEIHLQSRYRQP